MTDRELLELAGKAVGISSHVACAPAGLQTWNPLEDDGDALRLAVKLHIGLDFLMQEGRHWVEASGQDSANDEWLDEGDPCAMTRRAIVRAAATLGTQS